MFINYQLACGQSILNCFGLACGQPDILTPFGVKTSTLFLVGLMPASRFHSFRVSSATLFPFNLWPESHSPTLGMRAPISSFFRFLADTGPRFDYYLGIRDPCLPLSCHFTLRNIFWFVNKFLFLAPRTLGELSH